jgi:hypothetical protein
VSLRIAELRAKAEQRTGVTVDRILNELASIAFADIRDVVTWDGENVYLNPSADLTREQAGAISQVKKRRVVTSGESKSGTAVRRNGGAQSAGGNGIYGAYGKSGEYADMTYGDTGTAAAPTEGTVAIIVIPVISPEPPALPLPGPLVSLYGCRDTDSDDDTPDLCEANDWTVSPDGATLYPSGPLADSYRIAYLR